MLKYSNYFFFFIIINSNLNFQIINTLKSYPAVANTSPSDLKSIHKIEFFSTILESYFPDAACQYIIDPSELPDKKTPFNLLGLSRLQDKHVVGV